MLDRAWPNGIKEELGQPVAVLLNESADTLSMASQAGFQCFTETADFKRYVQNEILALTSWHMERLHLRFGAVCQLPTDDSHRDHAAEVGPGYDPRRVTW